MYQAMYRKYRPLTFDEVVGQDVITTTLKNAIKKDQISHAYLFTGPRGTGKTTIAKILSKTVNCENRNNLLPCNKCVSCTQIEQKQSTDIIEIDAASNNGVDEIREIRNKVNLVPSVSKYKVYIIDEVHMLTVGAFNALLKTLEEPPAHIIFILATTEPHKIPTTILSRCQRFDFKCISPNKIVECLKNISQKENIKIDDNSLFEIARLSDGGMRDAISMLDQVVSYSENEVTIDDIHEVNGTISEKEIIKFIDVILKENLLEALKLIDTYSDCGKNIVKLVEELITVLKNMLLFKTISNYFEDNQEKEILYKEISNENSSQRILELIDLFNDNIIKLKQSNDPKLIIELLIIKYISLSKKENLNEQEIIEHTKIDVKPLVEEIKKDVNLETKKEEKTEIIDKNKFVEIQNIRVNNTLAGFNKEIFKKLKDELDNIKDMLLIPEYSKMVSTILDGTIKAASNKNIIFVYNTNTSSNYFNENLLEIEEILEKNFNAHYDVIAVSNDSWETIKKEFNSKNKKNDNKEENFDLKKILSKEKKETTEIDELFGDIVEVVN